MGTYVCVYTCIHIYTCTPHDLLSTDPIPSYQVSTPKSAIYTIIRYLLFWHVACPCYCYCSYTPLYSTWHALCRMRCLAPLML